MYYLGRLRMRERGCECALLTIRTCLSHAWFLLSCRVHGVSGLRVADASVAPRIPSTPTQAMAMMIGDRAAYIALNDKAAKQQVQVRTNVVPTNGMNATRTLFRVHRFAVGRYKMNTGVGRGSHKRRVL